MNYLSIRFLLPKYEINQVIFSPLNVKITIRGRSLNPGAQTGAGWLLNLPEMKRIEKTLSGFYEKYVVSISSDRRDSLHELGTEQSIARMLFEAAETFLTDDDQFEIYAVGVEGFGKYGQYDCRFCPFDLFVDSLIKVAFQSGVAGDPGELGKQIGEAFGETFVDAMREGVINSFKRKTEEIRNRTNEGKTAANASPFANGGVDPRMLDDEGWFDKNGIDHAAEMKKIQEEMNSPEYRKMMREETTGEFQAQKHAAFSFAEAANLAFDQDHADHLRVLNAEDSVHWVDRIIVSGRVRILVYFAESDEGYIVGDFKPEDYGNDFDYVDQLVAAFLHERIKANKVALNQIWLNPMESHRIGLYLQQRGISVHAVAKMQNPVVQKIVECLKHIDLKQARARRDARQSKREVDRSLVQPIENAKPGDVCDFCFYDLQNFTPERFGDYYFCSDKCRIHFKVKNEIALTDAEHSEFLRFASERQEKETGEAIKIEDAAPDQDDAMIDRKMFSPEALEKSDFAPITKHLLSQVEAPIRIIHIIAPDIDERARFVQSFAFDESAFAVDVFLLEFNDASLIEQIGGLKTLNAEKPPHFVRGKTDDHLEDQPACLDYLQQNERKMLAVADPGNIGLNADRAHEYFGQMLFAIFEQSPDFNPKAAPNVEAESTVAAVNAPDPFFVGNVKEFVAEETDRLQNVDDSPNVENSTMADEARGGWLVRIPTYETLHLINETPCPFCNVVSGILCQDEKHSSFVESVHGARIAASDRARAQAFKEANPPLIVGFDPDQDDELYLDVDFERARAIHRIVRGFHDGECPNCNRLFDAREMIDQQNHARCPKCGFSISYEQKQAAIKAFAPVMKKNLEIFENWRTEFIKANNPDLFNAPDPETFTALINAVRCPVCGAGEGYNCESHQPKDIFSPITAAVHYLRKTAFDLFMLQSKGEYAPIKILDESPRATVIEKVSCDEPFCEAKSGGFKNNSQGESCVYSRDQRPEGSSTIENGVHLSRFEKYRDL